MKNTITVDATLFAIYAESNPVIWDKLIGNKIQYKDRSGIVSKVTQRPLYIDIKYDDVKVGTSTYNTDSFRRGNFTSIHVPREIASSYLVWEKEYLRKEKKERLQQESEKDIIREFNDLKEKYNIPHFKNYSPVSPLLKILIKMEEGTTLDNEEVKWLENNSLYNVIATNYYRVFKKNNDPWMFVKTCKFLRKCDKQKTVIELTEKLLGKHKYGNRLTAAILTTRGGAFRDISDLAKAEECARRSIQLDPHRLYAYNLLAAIYYELGVPQEGDKFFDKALQLGAKSKDQDRQIKTILDNVNLERGREIAQYLLKKDSKKYHWAEYYLTK